MTNSENIIKTEKNFIIMTQNPEAILEKIDV